MSFAEAGLVLKVDFRCESCRMILLEVLSSVIGVYNIDFDGDLVKVTCEVDPNRIFKAVARTGVHAKVLKASVKHPSWNLINNSTSLDWYQIPTTYPLDNGHRCHPAMLGGGHGYSGQFTGNPGFAGQFYGGPGFDGQFHDGANMNYPFGMSTMHGGCRRHPPMGRNGPWYPYGQPAQAFGGNGSFRYM